MDPFSEGGELKSKKKQKVEERKGITDCRNYTAQVESSYKNSLSRLMQAYQEVNENKI